MTVSRMSPARYGGYGYIHDDPHKGIGRGKPAPEEDVCGVESGRRNIAGGDGNKVLKPSLRKEMAIQVIAERASPSSGPADCSRSARPVTGIGRSARVRMPWLRTGCCI